MGAAGQLSELLLGIGHGVTPPGGPLWHGRGPLSSRDRIPTFSDQLTADEVTRNAALALYALACLAEREPVVVAHCRRDRR